MNATSPHARNGRIYRASCMRSNAGSQRFAKIDHPLGLEKTPAGVCLVSGLIFDQTVGAELAKAMHRQKCFDMRNKPRPDAPPPRSRLHPNAFEKRHRLAFAAIGRFADGYLAQPSWLIVGGFCQQ